MEDIERCILEGAEGLFSGLVVNIIFYVLHNIFGTSLVVTVSEILALTTTISAVLLLVEEPICALLGWIAQTAFIIFLLTLPQNTMLGQMLVEALISNFVSLFIGILFLVFVKGT